LQFIFCFNFNQSKNTTNFAYGLGCEVKDFVIIFDFPLHLIKNAAKIGGTWHLIPRAVP